MEMRRRRLGRYDPNYSAASFLEDVIVVVITMNVQVVAC